VSGRPIVSSGLEAPEADAPPSRVTLVDLGLGNVGSVVRAVERSGGAVTVTREPRVLAAADRLLVPGQGAFRDAAAALRGGLGEALRERLAAGVPYLGICLGMQVLFAESEESPGDPGLDVFPGRVRRLSGDRVDAEGRRLKVPHMGWNQVSGDHPLLPPSAWFYFTHSYVCVPEDPDLTVGRVAYGEPLCAAIARGAVFGCQFHPEKSQEAGRVLLRRFLGTRAGPSPSPATTATGTSGRNR